MYNAYLLLGSNLGDRKNYLTKASELIGATLGKIHSSSAFYQTASWGMQNQPDYLNQAIRLRTNLEPEQLLQGVLAIELELGRERMERWGSRTIDIDILLFEDRIVEQPDLVIPHPFLGVRRFSLLPLSEIAADIIEPVSGKTIEELLNNLSDNLSVKKLY